MWLVFSTLPDPRRSALDRAAVLLRLDSYTDQLCGELLYKLLVSTDGEYSRSLKRTAPRQEDVVHMSSRRYVCLQYLRAPTRRKG